MDTLTSTEDNNVELVLKELYIQDIMPCYCEEAFHVADEVLDTKIKSREDSLSGAIGSFVGEVLG